MSTLQPLQWKTPVLAPREGLLVLKDAGGFLMTLLGMLGHRLLVHQMAGGSSPAGQGLRCLPGSRAGPLPGPANEILTTLGCQDGL